MPWRKTILGHRRWLILGLHILLLTLTYYASFLLRFDFSLEHRMRFLMLEPGLRATLFLPGSLFL